MRVFWAHSSGAKEVQDQQARSAEGIFIALIMTECQGNACDTEKETIVNSGLKHLSYCCKTWIYSDGLKPHSLSTS